MGNNWEETQYFINRFNTNVGHIYNQINSIANQDVFLQECLHITSQCEKYEQLSLNRAFIERGYKLCDLEKDGWFVYNKQMKKLAYATALDILDSIDRKMGRCA